MQGAFAYCFKQNDIMQTTYDDVQDDAGRDLLAKIRLKRRTGPRTSRLVHPQRPEIHLIVRLRIATRGLS